MRSLLFARDDPRIRRLNDRPVASKGDFVLYWMQVFRRAEDNAALAYAIEQANILRVPVLVYEALRPDYPHASDRIHRFALEGASDTSARLATRGIGHAFFLPKVPAESRGVVADLASRARMVVSDDFPAFVVPRHNAAAAARAPCAFIVVDDCAVVPMALFGKPEVAARTLRPKLARVIGDWLLPLHDPEPDVPVRRVDLPFEPIDLTRADLGALVASCAVDHAVGSVAETRGGSAEAERRLARFVRGPLSTYDVDRNDPSREAATSGLSPYLHFGMISARRVALEAREWATGGALERFLEELLVRRALAFNHARTRPDHAAWAALPGWARATLTAHARDARYANVTVADLEGGRSPDPLWNAAMNELRARGTVQPYARMLWGKLPLLWMGDPASAHAALVQLNDKWALDGRDPNGYANVSWCFGLHDRPWPERAIFGSVRSMTSASARRKLDFEGYIARWGPQGGGSGPLFERT
jgi:deoxyribodipyrimidine photo-lyase